MSRTVVVTGASAGIGRASALAFGALGDRVALLARGKTGLKEAAKEIEHAGGSALVVPVDMADFAAVAKVADRVESELGAIDVWVNVAFTSVFAPFWDIEPDEFRRVTEVTYLGFVHGTRVALDRMRPRDHGTIVQVGSALSQRSIPLQSAYCGAKHAVNGFTSSLRTELMHEKSKVRVTVVQMPGLNTPQFRWVRNKLPHQARPVAPIYQPEVAARAVVHAAAHPRRKQYWVGGSTAATLMAEKVVSPLLDRYLARTGFQSQQGDEPVPKKQPDNLWEPLDGPDGEDRGAHGVFDDEAHAHSMELWCSTHARALVGAALGTSAAALAAAARRRRTTH